ncbi:MAG: ribosomal L7Ae/L30e/S12e/Gadd45 family protein [Eubacteriales bacterium]|nr:ribosomal L7Ae/L30e/S12e/Gadd45 family protein [Eubacteriales bacterium]
MLSQLHTAAKVVGIKQSKKIIRDGEAHQVFIAQDAEQRVTRPIYDLCEEHGVAIVEVPTMKELGKAAGIAVGAAVVTVTKETL